MRTGKQAPMRVRKRLCVPVFGGKQTIYFSKIITYFVFFWLFCKRNCYFEYCIRIRCIEVYMVTWFKNSFRHFFELFQKMSQKCEQFSYGTFGNFGNSVLNVPLIFDFQSSFNFRFVHVLQCSF